MIHVYIKRYCRERVELVINSSSGNLVYEVLGLEAKETLLTDLLTCSVDLMQDSELQETVTDVLNALQEDST